MNWYGLYKISAPQISIDVSRYQEKLRNLMQDLYTGVNERTQNLSKFHFDAIQTMQDLAVSKYPYLRNVSTALTRKDPNQIYKCVLQLYNYMEEIYKADRSIWQNLAPMRTIAKNLRNYADQLEQATSPQKEVSDEQIEAEVTKLSEATYKNMQQVAQKIQEAILRIPQWNGTAIMIEAVEPDKQNEFNTDPETGAHINLANSDGDNPFFTYFEHEGKVDLGDEMEAGQSEFFSQPGVQSDYVNLINEIKKPGSTGGEGKILTLYTARPIKDRQIFEGASQIPSNLFLTSNYNSAEGIARDLGGSGEIRDVWKVRINSKYLICTLDSPGEKQYQIGTPGGVPIKSMTLVSQGEPSKTQQPPEPEQRPPEPPPTTAANWYKLIKTSMPSYTVYRGDSYSGNAGAAHGVGNYYGQSPEVATRFSKPGTVKKHNVEINNPLVIASDEELKAVKQRAEKETGLDFGKQGNLYEMLILNQATQFTDWCKSKGYDGIVINYDEAAGGKQILKFHHNDRVKKIASKPFKFYMPCDRFRRQSPQHDQMWHEMMKNMQKVNAGEFLHQCDMSGMLDEDDDPNAELLDMMKSDPTTYFAKSTLGQEPVYFVGHAGIEFIFKR